MAMSQIVDFQFIFGCALVLTALIVGVMTRKSLLPSVGRAGGWLLWSTAMIGGSWHIYQAVFQPLALGGQ